MTPTLSFADETAPEGDDSRLAAVALELEDALA